VVVWLQNTSRMSTVEIECRKEHHNDRQPIQSTLYTNTRNLREDQLKCDHNTVHLAECTTSKVELALAEYVGRKPKSQEEGGTDLHWPLLEDPSRRDAERLSSRPSKPEGQRYAATKRITQGIKNKDPTMKRQRLSGQAPYSYALPLLQLHAIALKRYSFSAMSCCRTLYLARVHGQQPLPFKNEKPRPTQVPVWVWFTMQQRGLRHNPRCTSSVRVPFL
jgi:hypothetical protein